MKFPLVWRRDYEKEAATARELKDEISFNTLLERMALTQQVYSGESVTPRNAMRCTAIHGIVRTLTNAIGSYPVSVVDEGLEGGKPTLELLPEHQLTKRLQQPNAVHTSTEFFRLAMEHVALWGNFYALKGAGSTGPIGWLRPIEDPEMVSVDSIDWARTGVTFKVFFDNEQRIVPQGRMLHITSGILCEDGVTGESPIKQIKQAIGICLAAEKLIAHLYGQNDVPHMAFSGGKFKDKDAYDLWLTTLKLTLGRGPLLLPEGMDVKELTFKPLDAQLVEMIKQKSREIFSAYGVPPHKLADLERATFSNIEEQSLEFVRDVAKPYVKLFEQAMTRDLLSADDRAAGRTIKFNMQDATEGKFNDVVDGLSKLHAVGAVSPNEIRSRLGYNPRDDEGGDEYVAPANMRTTSDVRPDSASPPANGNGLDRSTEEPADLSN